MDNSLYDIITGSTSANVIQGKTPLLRLPGTGNITATDIGPGGMTIVNRPRGVLALSAPAPVSPGSAPPVPAPSGDPQDKTDTAASNPPYNPNTPPIQQSIPTPPDNTAATLAALSSLFSSAFASGTPAGGGGGNLPTSIGGYSDPSIDPATGVPYASETSSSAPASSSNTTTIVLLVLTAVGVFFAYKQYEKSKKARAAA